MSNEIRISFFIFYIILIVHDAKLHTILLQI